MELSVFLARVIALIYLSASFGAFLNREHYRRMLDDVYTNAALIYTMGFLAVIIGALIINYHNVWTAHWPVLITIGGWLALIKGVMLIVLPKVLRRMSERMLTPTIFRLFPYATLSLGVLFAYFGFFLTGQS